MQENVLFTPTKESEQYVPVIKVPDVKIKKERKICPILTAGSFANGTLDTKPCYKNECECWNGFHCGLRR